MKKLPLVFFLLTLFFGLLVSGCNTSKTTRGAVIGGAAGGVVGGAIGKKSGDGTKGAVIGSVIGGTAGAIIGDYMDRQAKEIEEEIPDATVDVQTGTDPETGEEVTTGINVTFDSGILFGFDSYALTAEAKAELDRMAGIFNRYPDTDLLIEGHTDSRGTDSYNMKLSQQRAASVADYLAVDGIDRNRMITRGYGETRPVASNDTDAGRAENRRVMLAITANENLRRKAEEGTLSSEE